jgi:hypothetical protein
MTGRSEGGHDPYQTFFDNASKDDSQLPLLRSYSRIGLCVSPGFPSCITLGDGQVTWTVIPFGSVTFDAVGLDTV